MEHNITKKLEHFHKNEQVLCEVEFSSFFIMASLHPYQVRISPKLPDPQW